MDKLKILMVILICMTFVSATSVERGHIVENEIILEKGILLISPSSITQTVSGGTINKQITLSLSSEKEFQVSFSSDLNVNFETENMTLSNGENILNFSLPGSKSHGFIFMNYQNQSYELVEIIFNVNSQNGGSSGSSSSLSSRSDSSINNRVIFDCGNGICDNGENANLCPVDCLVKNESESAPEITNTPQETKPFFSRITGAVIGAVTSTGGFIISIILVVLATTYFFVRKKLKKLN